MASTQTPKLGLILFSAIFVLSFFSFAILPSEAVSNSNTPTMYELLERNGLPRGILPADSVVDYYLSPSGRFDVKLKKPCYIEVDDKLYYDETITGVLGKGFITHLKGIEMNMYFFFWFDVDEISVDMSPVETINFQVGDYNFEYDVKQYKTARSCQNSVKGSSFRSFKGALQLPVNKAADLANGTQILAAEYAVLAQIPKYE